MAAGDRRRIGEPQVGDDEGEPVLLRLDLAHDEIEPGLLIVAIRRRAAPAAEEARGEDLLVLAGFHRTDSGAEGLVGEGRAARREHGLEAAHEIVQRPFRLRGAVDIADHAARSVDIDDDLPLLVLAAGEFVLLLAGRQPARRLLGEAVHAGAFGLLVGAG